MIINYNKSILLLAVFLVAIVFAKAQNKNASIIAGAAATQIHGDGMAGYNKLGLEFGISVESPLSDKILFQPEILYFQKGSSSNADTPFFLKYKLNYLELPLMFGYNINEFFQLQAGPSIGYLLNGEVSSALSANSIDGVNKIDASVMAGASYRFLANTSIKIRYAISFLSITKAGNSVNDTVSFLLIFHI